MIINNYLNSHFRGYIWQIPCLLRKNATSRSKINKKCHTKSKECGIFWSVIENTKHNLVICIIQTIMILSQQKSETLEL